jgi:hypothetical protein
MPTATHDYLSCSCARLALRRTEYVTPFLTITAHSKQRSVWARENLLVSGELEEYEDRLVDEWSRYRDVVFEHLNDESADDILRDAGKALYLWADMESGNIGSLRIRERVTEPYVVRGGFHILANARPLPRVHWHPRFMTRIRELLGPNE